MNNKPGGPAFPTPAHNLQNDGMTLRDYFAIHMQEPSKERVDDYINGRNLTSRDARAELRYLDADAMLKARGQA